MKVVINSDYGGFGLSEKAFSLYLKLKNIRFEVKRDGRFFFFYEFGHLDDEKHYLYDRDIERNDPILVKVVEELGKEANDTYASLKIVEIPEDVEWYIGEYDGIEHVAEKHKIWS